MSAVAVRRGSALLDEHGPKDWRGRIDFDSLNINHPGHCILGQLYGGYTLGRSALALQSGEGYGFTSNCAATDDWREELTP